MPKPQLGILMKPTSFDCNLACNHCYYRDVERLYPNTKKPRMSLEVVEAVCRQYRDLEPATPNIGWQGGEPTLMGLDFFRSVLEIEKKSAKTGDCWGNSLQTNGTLLDDKWCEFLAESRFLVGLSIDGPRPMNKLRRFPGGRETSGEVLKALSYLKKHRCEYNVLFVISRINCGQPEEIFNFLLENDLHYTQFIPCIEPAEETNGLSKHSIKPEEYAGFQKGLFDAWVENDDASYYIRHIDNWLHQFFGLTPEMCEYRPDCSNLLTVEWNGDVYPCDFFVQKRYLTGNVLTDTLGNLIQKRPWKNFVSAAEKPPAVCKGCRWFEVCSGGCYRQREKLGLGQNDKPYLCEANKQIFEHVFGTLKELKEKPIKPALHNFLKDVESKKDSLRNEEKNSPSAKKEQPGDKIEKKGNPARNDPCPCGSGKKFKKCCSLRPA